MKIRNGFVSNSSSSSFIIGCQVKPTKEFLLSCFKVNRDSPLYRIANEMAEIMSNCIEKKPYREDEAGYVENQIHNLGWLIFEGYVSDEDGYTEAVLCNMDIDYKDDNILIYKEGGY